MKKKDFTEFKKKEVGEMKNVLAKKLLELKALQVKIPTGKEKNLRVRKNLRQEIARILTVIREREIKK